MAVFDLTTFLELVSRGRPVTGALGTAFGMPSCLTNLTSEALQLLPGDMLGQMRGSAANAIARADDVTKEAFNRLRWKLGIIEFDTEEGVFKFVSDTSKGGIDRNDHGLLSDVNSFIDAVNAAAAFGGRLYRNYNTARAQIEQIGDCIQSYSDYLSFVGGNSADRRAELADLDFASFSALLDREFGADKKSIEDASRFIADGTRLLRDIDSILSERISNPNLEPVFVSDVSALVSGTSFLVDSPSAVEEVEIIRLAFGPPKSRIGQFVLSNDGLYYNSQASGLTPVLLELEKRQEGINLENVWRFEHDPNLGGRGTAISSEEILDYVNTILDPNIVDESPIIQEFYNADNLLQELIGQRNLRIYSLSGHIGELEASSGASQAIIFNFKQSLLSEMAEHDKLVNKRKKQIELAIKLPPLYGSGPLFTFGQIPVNDFSYLQDIDFMFDIQKQKGLILDQEEVSGIVLPVSSTFVRTVSDDIRPGFDHLFVPKVGLGDYLFDASTVSSTAELKLSLTQTIHTDGLFAVYNFLDTRTVDPSSTDFFVNNGVTENSYNNAQLVSVAASNVFDEGLGIPYLRGVVINAGPDGEDTIPSAVGSYVKLPDTAEFNDLFYSRRGCSIDCWVHVPEIDGETWGFGDGISSGLTRVLLGNENVGLQAGASAQDNELRLTPDFSDRIVRGMLIGFTRDRRITNDIDPTNVSQDNSVDDAVFFIAPTQSFDASTVGFLSKGVAGECASGPGVHNFKFSVSNAGPGSTYFSSIGLQFMHMAITLNPDLDELKVYLDSQLMATSSISQVFGTPVRQMPNIPSFYKNNSFNYSGTTTGPSAILLDGGPKLNQFFTPWIVGGGYTDGLYLPVSGQGNFMGGTWGGTISGLKGYVGSLKFYNKPLTSVEVSDNFNNQRVFFKNIDMPNLLWEPIISV
jgi:hypothetical protein